MQFLVGVTFLVGLLAVTAEPISDELKQKAMTTINECKEKVAVTDEMIGKMKSGGEIDPMMPCFVACMLQGFEILTEDGQFKKQEALDNIPEGVNRKAVETLIEKCGDLQGKDACDTAGLLIKCYFENKGEAFME